MIKIKAEIWSTVRLVDGLIYLNPCIRILYHGYESCSVSLTGILDVHVPDGDRGDVHVLVRLQLAAPHRTSTPSQVADYFSNGSHKWEVSLMSTEGNYMLRGVDYSQVCRFVLLSSKILWKKQRRPTDCNSRHPIISINVSSNVFLSPFIWPAEAGNLFQILHLSKSECWSFVT